MLRPEEVEPAKPAIFRGMTTSVPYWVRTFGHVKARHPGPDQQRTSRTHSRGTKNCLITEILTTMELIPDDGLIGTRSNHQTSFNSRSYT